MNLSEKSKSKAPIALSSERFLEKPDIDRFNFSESIKKDNFLSLYRPNPDKLLNFLSGVGKSTASPLKENPYSPLSDTKSFKFSSSKIYLPTDTFFSLTSLTKTLRNEGGLSV